MAKSRCSAKAYQDHWYGHKESLTTKDGRIGIYTYGFSFLEWIYVIHYAECSDPFPGRSECRQDLVIDCYCVHYLKSRDGIRGCEFAVLQAIAIIAGDESDRQGGKPDAR